MSSIVASIAKYCAYAVMASRMKIVARCLMKIEE